MKQFYLTLLLFMSCISMGIAQSKIVGLWIIDPSKSILLKDDQTFVHTIDDKKYDGTYTYQKKQDNTETLTMNYANGSKEYRIKMLTKSSLTIISNDGLNELKMRKEAIENQAPGLFSDSNKNASYNSSDDFHIIENKKTENNALNWKNAFNSPTQFGHNSLIFKASIGLWPDAEIVEVEDKITIPPLVIQTEKQLYKNVGVSASIGYAKWSALFGLINYNQFNFGLRPNYHLNLMKNLDAYVGVGLTFRYMNATIEGYYNDKSKLTLVPVLGATYYFKSNLGANIEVGNDNISWLKLGLSYKFN